MNEFQKFMFFLGRVCFSLIFILSGLYKMLHWDMSEQVFINQMLDVLSRSYEHPFVQKLFDHVLPLAPTLLVLATIIEFGGGLLILLGIQIRFSAFFIALFLVAVTPLFHNFWSLEGTEKDLQMTLFLKNLSLIGGALFLLTFGKGTKKSKAS